MDSSQSKIGNLRPMRPSIIIGLGGTGQRIILEVRKKIIQEYGSLDRIPIVGFLVIDTDPEKPIIPGLDDITLNKIQLAPSEVVITKVTGTHKLKEELNSYPHLSEWVDKSILEKGDVTAGAKGIRAIGRLSYFLNFSQIKKALDAAYKQVTDQPNLRYMAEHHGMSVASGVNVTIITSVCGGTGSGIFLDLAFTVKDMLAGTEHQRIGYLVLPGVFGTDIAKATGYAALRELNHYSMDRDFEANWENETRPRVIQPPPFDFCYIINNGNNHVNFSQKEHLFEMTAHNIFLEFSHEFGQYKTSLKDNIQAVATGTDKLGCPLNYISLGLSTISFPRGRIINACSHRLAKEVLQSWTSPKEITSKLNEYVDHFLDLNKLLVDTDSAAKNQFKDELLKFEGSNYYALVDEEMSAAYRGIRSQNHTRYDIYLEKRAEDFEKKFYEGDRDPSNWGEFFRGIHRNKEQKKQAVETLLVEQVSKMIQNKHQGLDYAKDFIEALRSRFDKYRDYFRTKFDELSKAEGKISKDRVKAFEDLKGAKKGLIFDRKRVMQDRADKLTNTRSGKLTNYFKRKLDKKTLEMSILLSEALVDYCKYLLREVDIFKDKLSRIYKGIEDTEKTLVQDTSAQDVYSLSLYDPSDVDFYYNEYVKSRDIEMNRDSVEAASQKVLEELNTILFDLRKEEFLDSKIRDALIKVCKPSFTEVENITVARKFLERYPAESDQMRHLRNYFSSSEVFLRFKTIPDFSVKANSKVSLIGVYEGRQPSLEEYKKLLPLLEKSCTDANQLRGINPIRQTDEILFTTEEGAFPLRRILEIDDYEAKYDKLSQGNQNPLHLRKYDKDFLVEIIQPTETEQRKAKIAVFAGIAMGIIKPDEDDENYMVYVFKDPRTGFIENKPIGRRNEEEKMIDTLLHRFNKELRDFIFRDVENRMSLVSKNTAEKKKVWQAVNDYRKDFLGRRDRELMERKQIPQLFKEIVESYNLYDSNFNEDSGGS